MNTRFLTAIAVLLLAPRMPSGPAVARAQIETNIHSFVGYPTDGSNPYAGLVQGSDGNFYGTTGTGGTSTKLWPLRLRHRVSDQSQRRRHHSLFRCWTLRQWGQYTGAGQ